MSFSKTICAALCAVTLCSICGCAGTATGKSAESSDYNAASSAASVEANTVDANPAIATTVKHVAESAVTAAKTINNKDASAASEAGKEAKPAEGDANAAANGNGAAATENGGESATSNNGGGDSGHSGNNDSGYNGGDTSGGRTWGHNVADDPEKEGYNQDGSRATRHEEVVEVVDQEAWDEPEYSTVTMATCNKCGATMNASAKGGHGCGGGFSYYDTVVQTGTIHHPAVTHQETRVSYY